MNPGTRPCPAARTLACVLSTLSIAAFAPACRGPEGSSCSVADNLDGTYTISCEDGTSVVVSDGGGGVACWDLDGSGTPDPATEDVNGDGEVGVLDCAGLNGLNGLDGLNGLNGLDGLHCWDVDGDGVTDPAEDVNGDLLYNAYDCVGPVRTPRYLDERVRGWEPANRATINAMLDLRGSASFTFDAANRPVAVFDWDNTVIRNDIGDATMFYMLANDLILQPPDANGDGAADWDATSWSSTTATTFLTSTALTALTACDGLALPGDPLPTSTDSLCADAIFNIYYNAAAADWGDPTTSTMNFAYAWFAQLLAGHTPSEVRAFATAAYFFNTDNPEGTLQTIGSNTTVTAWLRFYEQIGDLAGALADDGFDVWVVSASPQYVVEPLAAMLGIPADHVIGIRTVAAADGTLTYDLEECGAVADNTLITFDRGKRCWINKVIFDMPAGPSLLDDPSPTVFVAGDSDTDIAMLKDAEYKLVVRRNKIQTVCNAYAQTFGGNWMIEERFIGGTSCPATPYPCMLSVDHDGGPLVDDSGVAIPDQTCVPDTIIGD